MTSLARDSARNTGHAIRSTGPPATGDLHRFVFPGVSDGEELFGEPTS